MSDTPYITLSDIRILVNHPPMRVELIIRSSQFVDQLREPLHKGKSIGGSGNPVASLPLSTFKQMVEDGLLTLRPKAHILVGMPESRLGDPKKIMDKHGLEQWVKEQTSDKFSELNLK